MFPYYHNDLNDLGLKFKIAPYSKETASKPSSWKADISSATETGNYPYLKSLDLKHNLLPAAKDLESFLKHFFRMLLSLLPLLPVKWHTNDSLEHILKPVQFHYKSEHLLFKRNTWGFKNAISSKKINFFKGLIKIFNTFTT